MVLQGRTNKKQTKAVDKPSPTANISKIGSLKRFSDQDYANSLLHQVAKLVAPILHMNNFKVGTLCEMYPKNPNLLGLNVNRGQKILIRLRYHSNEKLFYPLGDIIGTMLHELTHNLYGPHDAKFYKFLDGLKKDFENIQYGTLAKSNYVCEEQTLGGVYNPRGGYISVREKRIAALSALKFKSESRKLGTSASSNRMNKAKMPTDPAALRKLILEATERRLKDSKWCPTASVDTKDIEPDNDDLDIVIVDEEENGEQKESNLKLTQTLNKKSLSEKKGAEFKEVIDLTNEEYEGKLIGDDEIIVIEGCEKEISQEGTSSFMQPITTADSPLADTDSIRQAENGVKKNIGTSQMPVPSLLPPLDDDTQRGFTVNDTQETDTDEPMQYSSSPSYGRTFIYEGNSDKYPRRKLVADLDFDQILKKGDKMRVSNSLPSLNEELSLENINVRSAMDKLDQEAMHVKKDSSLKGDSEQNYTQISNLEKTTTEPTSKSNKNTSEQAKMESKRRKSGKKKDSSKDSSKTAKNAKKTAKKAEQRELMKKTVKSIDFEDLFSKQ